MNVSVIIPAYNDVSTIRQTLDSLLAQTFTDWEAVVVDDGSTDETAALVAQYTHQDNRFTLVQQTNLGGSAARNTGLNQARFDWVLFLDADDWLLPHHLEKLTAVLQNNPSLDGAHCGWTRVSPTGELGHDTFAPPHEDLFEQFAQTCAFQPHTCLIRRSLVEAVGGWDATYRSCQDWDLWQRITRKGAKLAAVREVLARYRTRPGSVSLRPEQLLIDGLRVITQGHTSDPRIPQARHKNGRSAALLSNSRLRFICWPAGLLLGEGKDPRLVLPAVSPDHSPTLEATVVAELLFEAVLLPKGLAATAWATLWPILQNQLTAFLHALEAQAQATELAACALRHLEYLILQTLPPGSQPVMGATQAVLVEITQPIPDVALDTPQLFCWVQLEGEIIGTFVTVLPPGQTSKEVIASEITQRFAWAIIGRFFAHTLMPHLRLEQETEGVSVWRDKLLLAKGLPDTSWPGLHDQIGWLLFLQEIWQRPTWPSGHFYDPAIEEQGDLWETAETHFTVEVTQPLPDIVAPAGEFTVTLTVAGTPVCQTILPVAATPVKAQAIRAALTQIAGFSFCRVVVQEALLGQPFQTSDSLLGRLKQKTAERYPFFSIIVPTYGRLEALLRCVRAITSQNYPRTRFELLLVNDGGPPLPDLVAFQKHLPLITLFQSHAGPAAARNLAARQARGEYLVFIDDDSYPTADWLSQLAAGLRQTPHRAVGGPVLNALPENLYTVATQEMVSYLYKQMNTADTQFLVTSNLAVPAQLFHEVGEFNPVFRWAAGEDREFCLRWLAAGHKLHFVSQATVYHAHNLTFTTFCLQHFGYGRGAATLRQQPAGEKMPLQALSFYLNLVWSPLTKGGINGRSLKLSLLLALSQVVTALGFCWQKVKTG